MSVDGDGEQTAYLISLDYVGCDEMATGKDYKRFESETEIKLVRFGIDDVYVYEVLLKELNSLKMRFK